MPSSREDFLLRQIREIVHALARIAGLRREGLFAESREEIARLKRLLAGEAGPMLDSVDAATAVHLLGEPRRALTYAQLLAEEAAIERVTGDAARASRAHARALAVGRIVAGMREPLDGARALVEELEGQLG